MSDAMFNAVPILQPPLSSSQSAAVGNPTQSGSFQSLSVGFGGQVFRVNNQGVWLGAAQPAAAPFTVTMAGALTATNATIGPTTGQRVNISTTVVDVYDSSNNLVAELNAGGVEVKVGTDNMIMGYFGGFPGISIKNGAIIDTGATFYLGNKTSVNGDLFPAADNTNACGGASNRWTEVWAVNGAIQTSDERMKRNIAPIELGLGFINALKPVSFTMKDDTDGVRKHGLLAQDLLKLGRSELVRGTEEIGYGLNYADLVGPLIKAVQELSEEVQLLRSQTNISRL